MSYKNPITKPSQLTKSLVCTPMSDSWKEGQKEKWWSTHFTGKLAEHEIEKANLMYKLREKLLAFGGEQVCMPICPDEDYPKIMEKGQFFYGSNYMKKGRPSRCHENSSLLWEANKSNCKIATGYALSEDGMWREHSWVVQELATKYRIWETTEKRIAYFGYVMNEEECEEFAYWNT